VSATDLPNRTPRHRDPADSLNVSCAFVGERGDGDRLDGKDQPYQEIPPAQATEAPCNAGVGGR
jgi:hypothetical protein